MSLYYTEMETNKKLKKLAQNCNRTANTIAYYTKVHILPKKVYDIGLCRLLKIILSQSPEREHNLKFETFSHIFGPSHSNCHVFIYGLSLLNYCQTLQLILN